MTLVLLIHITLAVASGGTLILTGICVKKPIAQMFTRISWMVFTAAFASGILVSVTKGSAVISVCQNLVIYLGVFCVGHVLLVLYGRARTVEILSAPAVYGAGASLSFLVGALAVGF